MLLALFIKLAHGHIGRILGGFGVAFFGFLVLAAAWRLLALRGAIVTVSPRGIHDVRLTEGLVP